MLKLILLVKMPPKYLNSHFVTQIIPPLIASLIVSFATCIWVLIVHFLRKSTNRMKSMFPFLNLYSFFVNLIINMYSFSWTRASWYKRIRGMDFEIKWNSTAVSKIEGTNRLDQESGNKILLFTFVRIFM